MRKLMVVLAVIAMLAVAAVPAMAQSYSFEQEAESGDVSQSYVSNVVGDGNAVAEQVSFDANTGNFQNQEFFGFEFDSVGNIQYDNAQ